MGAGASRLNGPQRAALLSAAGMSLAVIATALHGVDRVFAPLTGVLIATALIAMRLAVSSEGTIVMDGSFVPVLVAAVVLGPAPALMVASTAELIDWPRAGTRAIAVLVNLAGSWVPAVAAWIVFSTAAGSSAHTDPQLSLAIAAAAVTYLAVNVRVVVFLMAMVDSSPPSAFPRQRPLLPVLALNVVLCVAAVLAYYDVGIRASVLVLGVVLVVAYMLRLVSSATQRADRITDLATSRQQLAARLADAEDLERRLLAESLHDGPVQSLLAARQDLEDSPHRDDVYVEHARSSVAATVDSLRQFVFALHPAVLDAAGLEAALRQLGEAEAERSDLDVNLDLSAHAPSAHDRLLFSLAREFVTNVRRHAQATRLEVSLARIPGAVKLEVRDNGVGCSAYERSSALATGHVGLESCHARVEREGGNMSVLSGQGGTRVSVSLPLADSSARVS